MVRDMNRNNQGNSQSDTWFKLRELETVTKYQPVEKQDGNRYNYNAPLEVTMLYNARFVDIFKSM